MDNTITTIKENAAFTRRKFLKAATGGVLAAGAVTLAASCSKHSDLVPGVHDAGAGDTGLLNLAYAMEQLEYAFYTKVTTSYYANATAKEKALLTDISVHERVHAELLQAVLGGSAIATLSFDFSHINFSDRASVLNFAKLIENTGIAAYNGAAWLYKNVDYMALTGKMVSVEARHATVINNFISFGNFADNTNVDLSTGMDRSKTPGDALAFINTYAIKKITAIHL